MAEQSEGNWFDNDPEWAELRRRADNIKLKPDRESKRDLKQLKREKHKLDAQNVASEPAERPQPPEKIDVSLNLTLPRLRMPRFTVLRSRLAQLRRPSWLGRLSRKQLMIGGAVTGVLLLAGVGLLVRAVTRPQSKPPAVLSAADQKPDFKVLAPKDDKTAAADDKLRYDPTRKVATFTDKIETTEVTVSQQPLPENFKSDTEGKVAELAKNINANEVISESFPKAYLGTSIKGPQTVVFAKNDLLVFIYAPRPIEKSSWAEYITKLL